MGSLAGGRMNESHLGYVFLFLLFAVVNILPSVIAVITSTAALIRFWGRTWLLTYRFCVLFFKFNFIHPDVFIKFVQGINFSQTQQFVTHNILMATCFDY